MGRLLSLLFVAAATSAGAATLEERLAECQEAHADCKEDCTTSYGSSFKLRDKLGLCLNKCTKRNNECRGRHEELDQAGIDEDSFDRKRPEDEATLPRKRTADVPSIPRRRSERESAPTRPEPDEEPRAAADEPPSRAERPTPRGEADSDRTEPARPTAARAEPARKEREPAAPPPSSETTAARPQPASKPDDGAQDEQAPASAEDEDAARAGAKKLMKKGIEEWDPSGE
jgi:hypothetical protein